jgi:hypothetical protein
MTTTDGIEGVFHAKTVSSIEEAGWPQLLRQPCRDSTDLIARITPELVSNKAGNAPRQIFNSNEPSCVREACKSRREAVLWLIAPGDSGRKPIGVVDLPPDLFSRRTLFGPGPSSRDSMLALPEQLVRGGLVGSLAVGKSGCLTITIYQGAVRLG